MNKIIAASTLCLSILLAVTAYAGGQGSMLKDTTESKYKVGQVWSYKTRPNDKKSSFIVVKVESHLKLGNIIHIALRGPEIKEAEW